MSRIDTPETDAGHPDPDLLADLAAQVLPAARAADIQSHVAGCAGCQDRLAAAERVRLLLQADDPGPMPAPVLARIERALAAAQAAATDQAEPAKPTRHLLPVPATETPAAAATATGPGAPSASEQLPISTRRARRFGWASTPVRFAAAVVLLAGVGSAAWLAGVRPPSNENVASGASSAAGSVAAPRVLETGQDYRQSTLAGQVRTLVATGQRVAAQGQTADQEQAQGASGSDKSAGQAQVGGQAPELTPAPPTANALTKPGPAPRSTEGDQSLRTGSDLQACLSAVPGGGQPLVVDLARYQGRDAAIVVLPATNGYDVYVVARSCAAGAPGILAHTFVSAS